MPLNLDHVYTDRARVIRREVGARVNFETQVNEFTSQWFSCRIAIAEGTPEGRSFNRRQIDATHLFIANLIDFDGNPVIIESKDRIEVETGPPPYRKDSLDAGVYEIMTIATKPRNLQEELLWYVPLRKLKEY